MKIRTYITEIIRIIKSAISSAISLAVFGSYYINNAKVIFLRNYKILNQHITGIFHI